MQPLVKLRKFDRGITDQFGRGEEHVGMLEDCKNLLPLKLGLLQMAYGFSETGGWSSMPTGFLVPTADSAVTFDLTSVRHHPFAYSSETPESYDARLHYMRDNQGSPLDHYVLDRVYGHDGNRITTNSNHVLCDEYKIVSGADITIAGTDPTRTIIIQDTEAGRSLVDNYYKGWTIEWWDDNVGVYESAYIVSSDYDEGTEDHTLTVLENLAPTTGGRWHLNWDSGSTVAADTFTLRRWFHRSWREGSGRPTFDTLPGQAFAANGRLRFNGGRSSNEAHFPVHAAYIDRTWFQSEATQFVYKGTYVDQMECNPYCRDDESSGGRVVEYASQAADADANTGQFTFGWTLEYDGFQESRLIQANGATITSGNVPKYTIIVEPSVMSKRVTAVNAYCSQSIGGKQGPFYLVRRHDILLGTSNNSPAGNDAWDFEPASHTDGRYVLTIKVDGGEWASRFATYEQRTGRAQEDTAEPGTERHIVNWLYTGIVGARRFFGNFYDPNPSENILDAIRYTPIASNGTSSYDTIPAERGEFEQDVARGDPESITGITEDNNWLIVFKDKSIYSYYIGPFKEQWVRHVVSLRDGTQDYDSIVKLPEGRGIVFADEDHLKLLQGQRVRVISDAWKGTYRTYITPNVGNLLAWYDQIDHSYRICKKDDSTRRVWVVYPERPYNMGDNRIGFPLYQLMTSTGRDPSFLSIHRDGSVLMVGAARTDSWVWHEADVTFDTVTITPYFKTHEIVPDDTKLWKFDGLMVVCGGTRTGGGDYDIKVWIDGTQVLKGAVNPFDTLTKTFDHLLLKAPMFPDSSLIGKGIQIEWNTDAAGLAGAGDSDYPTVEELTLYASEHVATEKSR